MPSTWPFVNTMLRLLPIVLLLSGGCHSAKQQQVTPKRFSLIPASQSGIDFENRVQYTEELNCYTFRNFYNGGGVGLGDFNNDGLVDIFFCANMSSNRLYLNRGDFHFEDVTEQAGIGSQNVWTSGVAVADVNGDGWLDLYVLKSGPPGGPRRYNELFINNGPPSPTDTSGFVPTFSERARQWGIADEGLSVHGAFFDYDRDGDLDLYLLNNSLRSVGGYDLIPGQRNIPDPHGGNKLYRHDGDHFTDVTQDAGIFSSNIGFGLGVSVGDINLDGWPDLFVSNDFFERDYLYLNNGDGTFTEALERCIAETSMGSMGADIADLNNDALPDIFVTEMLPEDDRRIKTKTKFENWDLYQREVKAGYFHQFTRNTLQLNVGACGPDGLPHFFEISRLAGVHATDWSWGALAFDMDNDGWRDLFVANGIGKDLTDQDYVNFYSDPDNVRAVLAKEGKAITQMVDAMPSEKIPNYAFRNLLGDSTALGRVPAFKNMAAEWGLDQPSFSNGSAYADLDNDGDLDLVVNNQDMPAFVYRNNSRELEPQNAFLSLELLGKAPNTRAFGSRVLLRYDGKMQLGEVAPMRGFESTVDHRLHFGLGKVNVIDTVEIHWPNGQLTALFNVPVNQHLRIAQNTSATVEAQTPSAFTDAPQSRAKPVSQPFFQKTEPLFEFRHRENEFSDFDRDRLLFHMRSNEGPPLAMADVNGDNQPDFYIGGAKDQPGVLLLSRGKGYETLSRPFDTDKLSEDTDACFFDADGDGDQDLYVASGGNEFPQTSSALLDRLYLNDGRGKFVKSEHPPLPLFISTGCVVAHDFDGDGDEDLFVGERLKPFFIGVPCDGFLLQNDGKGNFRDVTDTQAPGLRKLGMITCAVWLDADGDGDGDLAVAGEYMPVFLLRNEAGQLGNPEAVEGSAGWWHCLAAADLDGDGDTDLAAGNHGWNSRFKASPDKPLTMWVNDFDRNGTAEQIVCVFNGEESYPMALRNDLVNQMPTLKKKYLKFNSYANQTIDDIFTPDQMAGAIRLEAVNLASSILLNDGAGHFTLRPMPVEAQFAPLYTILARDLDGDGLPELIAGGNLSRAKPETGIYMSSAGWVLSNKGGGRFDALWPCQSGLLANGEIRSLGWVPTPHPTLLVVRNNDAILFFKLKQNQL